MGEEYFLPPPPPKYRFIDLLTHIYNSYTCNPSISIPLFIRDSITSLTSVFSVFIFIFLVKSLSKFSLDELISFLKSNIDMIILASFIIILVYILIISIAYSYYWCLLIPAGLKIFREKNVSLNEMLGGIQNLKTLFKALLASNLITILIPASLTLFSLKFLISGLNVFSIIYFVTIIFFSLIVYLLFNFLFIYVPHVAYMYKLNPFKCLSMSVRLVFKTFLDLIVYILVLATVLGLIAILVSLFELLNISISNMMAFIFSAILMPIIDLSLFGTFFQAINYTIYPIRMRKPLLKTFFRYLKTGLSELKLFIKSSRNYLYIFLSIIFLILSTYAGIWIANTYLHSDIGKIVKKGRLNRAFSRYIPLSLATEIFFNNWRASIIVSVGGIISPIPSLLIEFVNGIILGLVTSTLNFKEYMILIMPHGIIELPSFLIAISMGIRLGTTFLFNRKYLSQELRRAVLISIGLAPLFFIAAIIEAYITPFLARNMLGWR